jgi:quercetin dioxygenase-like cupin family protein
MRQKKLLLAASFVLAFIISSTASRAQDGVKRTDLQTHDLSIPGRQVVQQMVELQPGILVSKHTHPGEEVTVVLEGELRLEVAGKPVATLKAGEAFTVPSGAVHSAASMGRVPVKLLVTYVVEKGKPLRTAVQ